MATAASVTIAGPAGVRLYGGRLAPAVLGGSVTAADAVASGSLAVVVPGVLTGSVTAADAAPSGTIYSGAAPVAADAPATLLNETGTSGVRFSAGMAFREGDVPDGLQLTCADLTAFQGVVLNRWPDGSVKFAVVAGQGSVTPSSSAAIAITGAAGSPGSPVAESVLITAAPQAVIGFSGVGTVALADLLGVASTLSSGRYTAGRVRTLWEGPLCSSWLYYSRIAGHEHLAAWFEVRCWSDGVYEILPWIENGWWNIAAPDTYSGTVTFALGGSTVVSQAVTLHHHARVALVGSDPQPHRVGGNWATLLHSPAYLQSTDMVPTYRATASEGKIASLAQTYTPLAAGSDETSTIPASMGSGGYSPSIGPLPEWDAIYVSSADRRALRTSLVNAFMYGRFACHYRDETTNQPVAPGAYPSWLIRSTDSGISSVGASSTNSYTPTPVPGSGPAHIFADTHHPSGGYLAYLSTGWAYHRETTQAVAGVCCYRMQNVNRQNEKHLFRGDLTGAMRGMAWSTRSVAQAAAITPDGDALQTAMVSVLQENIDFNHATYVAQANNPFGFMADQDAYTPAVSGTVQAGATDTVIPLGTTAVGSEGVYVGWQLTIGGTSRAVTAYNGTTREATVGTAFPSAPSSGTAWSLSDNIQVIPPWMHDFMTMAQGYALCIAPVSSGARTKLEQFFEWKARSAVGRMGAPGVATSFNYTRAAQFTLAGHPADAPDVNGGTGPWYADWGAIYQATLGIANTADPSGTDTISTDYGSWPQTTGSWAILVAALAYCVRHRVPYADTALARVTNDSAWSTFEGNLATSPVWGLAPGAARMPAADQAVGTVIDYSLNTIIDINPGNTTSREGDFTQAGLQELFIAWGGMGWQPWRSRGYFMGNGHGSGCANDVVQFDHQTRLYSIIKPRAPWSVVRLTYGARTWESDSTTTEIALQPNMSSATDGAYVGWTLQIGAETRTVTGYVGGTVRRATVGTPFSAAPVRQPYLLTDGTTTIGALAQAGTTTTSVVLPSTASASTGLYYAWYLRIGAVERQILSYTGSTRTANLVSALAGAAAGLPVHLDAATGYIADRVTGWHWSSAKGIAVDVGQPPGSHTYGWQLTLPPDAINPTGPASAAPDGYYVTPGSTTMPLVGSDGSGQLSVLPIGASAFQAVGTPFSYDPGQGPSIYDRDRNRVVLFANINNSTREALDLRAGTISTVSLGATHYAYSGMGDYMERHGLYTFLVIPSNAEGGIRFMVSDPRAGTNLPVTYSGTAPAQQGSGRHYALCWIEPWQCWACYAGDGSNTIWFLKAPANPRVSNVWTWVSRTFTGTAYSNYSATTNPPYNRLAAVRESCNDSDGMLMWFPLVGQPAQRIRVARP